MRALLRLAKLPALLLVLAFLAQAAPAAAQADATPAADDTPWQTVISHQIAAFRAGDAPEAFLYAGHEFQETFSSPFVFYQAIIASGYAPIAQSTSHTFGHYELSDSDATVMQLVTLIGKSQELYEAVYQLKEEDGEWRVQGVALQRSPGIAL